MMENRKFDVIVAGAGPAGFCAAIAAARMKSRVLLAENSDSILGNLTSGPLEAIMTFHDEKRQVVKGIAEEFVSRCRREQGSLGHIEDTTGYAKTITPFSPEICKCVGFEMLSEAGVEILLQVYLKNCTVEEGHIKNLEIGDRNESRIYEAAVFIDCTGDGDLAAMAGAGFHMGDAKGAVQPMTSLVQLGGVDTALLAEEAVGHPEEFSFFSETAYENMKKRTAENESQTLHLWGFGSLLEEGYKTGALSLKRQEMHVITGYQPGEVILNFTRADGNPLHMADRSRAQLKTVIQGFELWKWLKKRHPAFKESYLVKTGRIGIREGRRVDGHHCITRAELEEGGVKEHSVAMGAFPMDIHSPGGESMEYYTVNRGYQIPLESLAARDLDNLLAAGRCICCTHEAQGSLRITATAMATGHGAGVCAALASRDKRACISVNYEELKKNLLAQDAVVE